MNKILLFSIGILLSIFSSAQKLTLVKDIKIGPGDSQPQMIGTLSNGDLMFMADDGVHGKELWRSDGTANGTVLVKDIWPGTNNTYAYATGVLLNGKIIFKADDSVHGQEIWVTDGTSTGTYMLKDIWPGTMSGFLGDGIIYQGKYYFTGRDDSIGSELWVTDGTVNGTKLFKNISLSKYTHLPNKETGSTPEIYRVAFGKLYFTAWTDVFGRELYECDGTTNGTKIVFDLFTGDRDGIRGKQLKLFKNKLYFIGASNDNISWELYSFDGNSISLIKDINPSLGESSRINSWGHDGFISTADKLYFKAAGSMSSGTLVSNSELWMTDGTTNGTKLVKEIEPGPTPSNPQIYASINNKIIFSPILMHGYTSTQQNDAREMWVSDGTANGTKKIVELDNTGVGAYPIMSHHMSYDEVRNPTSNGIYFFAGKQQHGSSKFTLWGTDGTTIGTFKVDNSPTLHKMYDILINGNDIWVSIADTAIPSGVELFLFDMTNLPYTASVNNINSESSFTIYPNPNNGVFSIKLDEEGFAKGYLRVVDVTGRIVYDQSIAANQQEVSISKTNLPKGLYHVMVQIDGKKMSQTVRIE